MSTYKFKTTKIKGKDYVEVNERIKFFRLEKKYDGWAIQTEFPMLTSDEALCRCTITNSDGMLSSRSMVMLLLPSRRLGCKSLCDDSVSTAA